MCYYFEHYQALEIQITVFWKDNICITKNTLQNNNINFLDLKLIIKNHKFIQTFMKNEMIFHLMLIPLLILVLVCILLYIEIFYPIIYFE